MMRLFLAFTIDDAIRKALSDAQGRLREGGADIRWSAPEGFHLTLKFLGDIEDPRLPDIEDAAAWLAGECAPFRFRLRRVSTFPKRGPEVKVLWAAVTEGRVEWAGIATKAQEAFGAFGVPQEGGLVAHVTLGRVRGGGDLETLRAAITREATTDFGEQGVSELVLMRTTLDPGGAIYEEMGRWPLGGPPADNI